MTIPPAPPADDEIHPYLVYRVAGKSMECALWTLEQGQKCLALFLTDEGATNYIRANQLSDEWKLFQPGRDDLLKILKHCCQSGVRLAVLNPDHEQAARLFNLEQVLKNAGIDSDA